MKLLGMRLLCCVADDAEEGAGKEAEANREVDDNQEGSKHGLVKRGKSICFIDIEESFMCKC